jgi:hypothetical protein
MLRKRFTLGALVLLSLMIPWSAASAQGYQGDQVVIGQGFLLAPGEELNGNLAVIGGPAIIEKGSTITGNLAVVGGKLTLSGEVQGDLVAIGAQLILHEGAVVEGDLVSFGASTERAPGVVVHGDSLGILDAIQTPWHFPWSEGPRWWRPGVTPLSIVAGIVLWPVKALGWGLLLALLGVLAVSVAPEAIRRVSSAASTHTVLSCGVGLLTLVIAAVAGTLLIVLCCLGLLVWALTLFAWLVGWLGVGFWAGQLVLQSLRVRNASALGEVALGLVLITVLARLPWCIGGVFGLILGSLGLGAVVLTRFGLRDSGPRRVLQEEPPIHETP